MLNKNFTLYSKGMLMCEQEVLIKMLPNTKVSPRWFYFVNINKYSNRFSK